MKCPTYKLLLKYSESVMDDEEMKRIKKILFESDVSEKDYFITIESTPFNTEYYYTTAIVILRNSYEEAEPIANEIGEVLGKYDIKVRRVEATLLWEESGYTIQDGKVP